MEILVITLDLPPKELNPNVKDKMHWAAVHRVKRKYRQDARLSALAAIGREPKPLWREARLATVFVVKDPGRRRDPDNLMASLKSGIDGLVDAGVFEDDDRITYVPPIVRGIEKDKDAGGDTFSFPHLRVVVQPVVQSR